LKVPFGMVGVIAPEVVENDVRNAEKEDEKHCAPLCLEPNGDHGAGYETDQTDDDAEKAPFAIEDETDKQENEEDPPCELKVGPSIHLGELRKGGKHIPSSVERVGEYHEETTEDGEIAQEEIHVKDETIAKRL